MKIRIQGKDFRMFVERNKKRVNFIQEEEKQHVMVTVAEIKVNSML